MVLASRLWAPDKPNLDELLQARPAWTRDALCREYPHVDFFPGQGVPTEPAKSVCARCVVRNECLAYAVERNEDGVWGGTSKRERRVLGKIVSVSGRGAAPAE